MVIKVIENKGDDLTINIEGFFDCTEITEYDKFIEKDLNNYQYKKLIVDLKSLEFIDSMGMGRLIILKKKMTKESKAMEIKNVSDEIKSIFKIAELSEYLLEE